jgi:hypothetical protein
VIRSGAREELQGTCRVRDRVATHAEVLKRIAESYEAEARRQDARAEASEGAYEHGDSQTRRHPRSVWRSEPSRERPIVRNL